MKGLNQLMDEVNRGVLLDRISRRRSTSEKGLTTGRTMKERTASMKGRDAEIAVPLVSMRDCAAAAGTGEVLELVFNSFCFVPEEGLELGTIGVLIAADRNRRDGRDGRDGRDADNNGPSGTSTSSSSGGSDTIDSELEVTSCVLMSALTHMTHVHESHGTVQDLLLHSNLTDMIARLRARLVESRQLSVITWVLGEW